MDKETITITKATEADLPEILKLQYLAYQSEAIIAGTFDIPPLKQTFPELRAEFQRGSLLKAVDSTGKILGSVRYFHLGDTVSIGKLMVLPNCQGHGLGTRLLLTVEENCPGKRLELFTGKNSIRNIALYERCGFCKFKEKIVNENLTLVYMEKRLSPMVVEYHELQRYLGDDDAVDFRHPAIQKKADELFGGCATEEDRVRVAFEFVCNDISHSADIHSLCVTRSASEVLLRHEGICYAKSMLLAALLRARDIPCGFCYQQLRLDGTLATPLVIHALNAVYFATRQQWIRIDARGNTRGIHAQFVPGEEHLAFLVHPELGETNDAMIYAAPPPAILQTLNAFTDCAVMFEHLPEHL